MKRLLIVIAVVVTSLTAVAAASGALAQPYGLPSAGPTHAAAGGGRGA
jgi:hypothetical protein